MKNVSLLAIGGILGAMTIMGDASAKIVSRSFLENALTDYATNTALDLKADKADVTALSNKIGDAWPYMFDMSPGLNQLSSWGLYPPEAITLENVSDLVRFLFGGEIESGINQAGVLNLLGESVFYTGAYDINTGQIDDGFRSLLQLTEGWTDSKKKTYLGVKGLNEKIGTLPTEIVIGNSSGSIDMFNITKSQSVSLPKDYTLSDFIQNMYYGTFGSNVGLGESPFYGLSDIIDHVMYGGIIGEFDPALAGKKYKGLIDLTLEVNKIGTLPSGNFPLFPGHEFLFSELNQPLTYPTSLAELINAIYGNSETGGPGLLAAIIAGFQLDIDGDGSPEPIGLLRNHQSAAAAKDLANANTAKIGTVPDGKNLAGMISETDAKIGAISPNTTVSEMIANTNAKFGVLPPDTTVVEMIGGPVLLNEEKTIIPLSEFIVAGSNGQPVINPINGATMPFPLLGLHDLTVEVNKIGTLPGDYETVGDALGTMDAKIGTLPDGKNLAGMISETDAKIGTLPDGYDSVGAALTAIKGIAEEAKAAALAAIPDPKQEGSTGKYVLTVDIIGDNATYRWEKIDRSKSESTTTE